MRVDPMWMRALLMVHIAAGFGSFLLAPVALATAKGGRAHRRWGTVYLWCMGVVAATAIPMALYRPVLFLALVAVFSFYLAFSGYRILRLKDLARGGHAKAVDWMAAALTAASSLLLAGLGLFRPALVQNFTVVGLVFGYIGLRAAAVEMRKFARWPADHAATLVFSLLLLSAVWAQAPGARGIKPVLLGVGLASAGLAVTGLVRFRRKPLDRMFWWYTHLGNFIGSYIAAWSAFSVVTIAPRFGDAGWVVWLWPTMVGVPAIVVVSAYYSRRFAAKASGTPAAA